MKVLIDTSCEKFHDDFEYDITGPEFIKLVAAASYEVKIRDKIFHDVLMRYLKDAVYEVIDFGALDVGNTINGIINRVASLEDKFSKNHNGFYIIHMENVDSIKKQINDVVNSYDLDDYLVDMDKDQFGDYMFDTFMTVILNTAQKYYVNISNIRKIVSIINNHKNNGLTIDSVEVDILQREFSKLLSFMETNAFDEAVFYFKDLYEWADLVDSTYECLESYRRLFK